jgi:hypothetical protein
VEDIEQILKLKVIIKPLPSWFKYWQYTEQFHKTLLHWLGNSSKWWSFFWSGLISNFSFWKKVKKIVIVEYLCEVTEKNKSALASDENRVSLCYYGITK